MGYAARPTIGFLTANIHTGAARVLWPGVLDAAQAGNVNLICYPGGRLRSPEDFEAERNVIFQLIDTERIDGLVSWTSAMIGGGPVTTVNIVELHQLYAPLPIVSLALPLIRGALVSISGYHGMHELVSHLYDVHRYHKIALIRGPEEHPYAMERYDAFLDALKEKGISPDPRLITPPASWEMGAEAMQILLDKRQLKPGVDFQAIVAASDLLAIGVLGILAERGIRVPTDVAVVGFNNIEEGRLVRPPLTSVTLPFYEQGQRSIETLLQILAGENVPDHTVLDSQLLVRQSCGCPSRSVGLAVAEPDASSSINNSKSALNRVQEQLITQIVRVISNRGLAATWAKQLEDTFRSEINGKSHGQFQSTLGGMLQRGVLDGDETAAWQNVISVLRRELLPTLNDQLKLRAEDLLGQARVVIGEAVQRAQSARQLQIEHQNQALRDIGQALITTFNVDKLADVLAERLPDLGIKSCYLALYEHPADSLEWSKLVLAYTDGRRANLPTTGLRFPSRQLIPFNLLPTRRYSLVVEPLYFQTEALGFVAFEVGPHDGDIYEVLRGHISSALKGALLFQEAYEARRAAEGADQIKTRLLANVSHELRTPLNIIIGHAQRLQASSPVAFTPDLEQIQGSAEHQLRLINDLLDLSRAEINALDLYPVLLKPKTLIEETFAALANDAVAPGDVAWRLDLPDDLPAIKADPVRLRQILLNLLSNAAKFTQRGSITLGAKAAPPQLHLWVADTGAGIPPELVDHIYEPFSTHEPTNRPASGIGLGLSITKHLIALHKGSLALETQPGQGSTFHIYLPLPAPDTQSISPTPAVGSTLWLISNAETPSPEILNFSQNQQLTIQRLNSEDELGAMLAGGLPAVVVWDMTTPAPGDWMLIRRLHNHPQLSQTPFVLVQQKADSETVAGITSLIVKPASSQALWEAIRPTIPPEESGSVLIIDDDDKARRLTQEAVSKGLPGYTVRTANGGEAGLTAILADPPSLVILDLMMPDIDGFEVLDRMRANERTQRVPVVILSGRQLSLGDVKRLEPHAAVTLHGKDILTEDEVVAALHRSLFGEDTLPPETSALVKRTVAYLHQNYARPLARWEIAEGIGASEDYLSRLFNRELGLSPWDYLNRYRISRAKELLWLTHDSVSQIGRRVGFSDPAYFSRVFRRLTGVSPRGYRHQTHR